MELKKYSRWPQAIIDSRGIVWKRSKVKGWFDWVEFDNRNEKGEGEYCCHSKFMTHPDFFGCKKIMSKKELIK